MVNAYSDLGITGLLRQSHSDFRVVEDLGIEPSGEGEHVMLWVEKRGANTEWVAKQIARYAGVAPRDVSFAGVKDRHAITQQWFSVWIKNQTEPDWLALQDAEYSILQANRHARKIKRGVLKGNYFEITIQHLQSALAESVLQEQLVERINTISACGVPNYFGEQRFGIDNINKALTWFAAQYRPKKQEKAWLISAARAHIFNQVLAARVEQQNWQTVLDDDVLMLDGSNSIFINDDTETNQQRYLQHDLHITGPLYGDCLIDIVDDLSVRTRLEQKIYQACSDLCKGLDAQGAKAQRRALRLLPKSLSYEFAERSIKLKFYLPAGAYATTVVSNLISVTG